MDKEKQDSPSHLWAYIKLSDLLEAHPVPDQFLVLLDNPWPNDLFAKRDDRRHRDTSGFNPASKKSITPFVIPIGSYKSRGRYEIGLFTLKAPPEKDPEGTLTCGLVIRTACVDILEKRLKDSSSLTFIMNSAGFILYSPEAEIFRV